jgi:hypothetical protein
MRYAVHSLALAGILLAASLAHAVQHAIVEVEGVTPERLAWLQKEGFTIDARFGQRVRLYARPAALKQLEGAGLHYQVVGQDPSPLTVKSGAKGLGVYHDHAAITAELQAYAAEFPALCRLVSLGNSVQGREIWALKITDNPDLEEAEPEFRYISTLHGDELVGTEMCLYFIDRLLRDYDTDPDVETVVNETEIWMVPLANPDGLEAGSRFNAHAQDLNRSFPAYPEDFTGTLFDESLDLSGFEPEVALFSAWTMDHRFVLSANIHTGAMLVNYPYDDDDLGSVYSPSPDDALFQALSRAYSSENPSMWNSLSFPDGITNGAAWYSISGGFQDFGYRYGGALEITLEISEIKTPAESTLPGLWTDNDDAMFAYLQAIHQGVRGIVRVAESGDPLSAKITVAGNTQPVFTDPEVGDYYRLLLPGTYSLTVEAPHYQSLTIDTVVVAEGTPTVLDVSLTPIGFSGHSADINEDFVIQRDEMLAVINLYQAEEYHCSPTGYGAGGGDQSCTPHDSDYQPQDWRIDMHELLRVFQFYNAGAYHAVPDGVESEDGFLPGAAH